MGLTAFTVTCVQDGKQYGPGRIDEYNYREAYETGVYVLGARIRNQKKAELTKRRLAEVRAKRDVKRTKQKKGRKQARQAELRAR